MKKAETERTGLRVGYEINAADTQTLYLTSNSNGKSAAEIKRDHMDSPNKFIYLDDEVKTHNRLYHQISNNGLLSVDTVGGSKAEQDAFDAVQTAIIPLLERNGEIYGTDARKASRNAAGKNTDDKNRDADEMNAASYDEMKETSGDYLEAHIVGNVFDTDGKNEFSETMKKAIRRCSLDDEQTEIVIKCLAFGVSVRECAEMHEKTKSAVDRLIQKFKSEIVSFIAYDEKTCKAVEK